MIDYRLKKESIWTPKARATVLIGFALRLVMLFVIIYALDGVWDLYYLEDDKAFEELAGKYLYNSHGMLDFELMEELTRGWASPFWAYVLCVSTGLTKTIYAARYINVILSTICIAVVYCLCYEISQNKKTALLAARLFAYLPVPILISCFPFKDVLITLGVMYAFYIFICVQKDKKVSAIQFLLCALLLVCVYFTRGAVTELMLIFLLIYYLQKLFRKKRYLAALLLLMGAVAIFVAFRSTILSPFETKVDTYENYGADEASGLNAIRITGITDIYKLPLTYAFAMLQPMKLELLAIADNTRPWRTVMTYANITMYPVVVGAWLYMFCKKHNLFFWLSSFIMFSSVIVLSLGVSRHYLFLLPIHMINFSLYMEDTHINFKNRKTLVIVGTFALFVLVFCYSLVKLM
ncbi:MAG: hypothetical protein IJB36_00400 [Clostridia bacterium]|nr:hypothetical protein [Clostridia bacterium]